MPLLILLGVLIVAGVLFWLVNTCIPMYYKVNNIRNVVCVTGVHSAPAVVRRSIRKLVVN